MFSQIPCSSILWVFNMYKHSAYKSQYKFLANLLFFLSHGLEAELL